jgi:hypothetical protein
MSGTSSGTCEKGHGRTSDWHLVTDPRAADVAETERLIAEARQEGVARLPALSAGELWVLCGDQQVLADASESQWWASMTDEQRTAYATGVMDFLADRELLRRAKSPPADDGHGATTAIMPMTPALGLVVAARQYPAVVVVCSLADGSIEEAPKLYGLAGGDQTVKVLVFEYISAKVHQPFGRLHHFSLVSVQRAARSVALWSTSSSSGGLLRGRLGGKSPQRIIDVYRNRSGEPLTRDRVLVGPVRDRLHEVRIGTRSAAPTESPAFCDFDELTSLLEKMLADDQS